MSGYTEGRRIEHEVIHHLTDNGYECIRAAGSKGPADVAGFKPGQCLFVSVKRTNPVIPPAEREALLRIAEHVNGLALVATKPLRQPLTYRRLTGPGPKEWQPWTPDELEKP